MKNIKLLIFDLDNTLINYGGVTEKAWQLASKKCTNTFDLSIDVKDLTNQIMKVGKKLPKFLVIKFNSLVMTFVLQILNLFKNVLMKAWQMLY